jgi:hypothetical protein
MHIKFWFKNVKERDYSEDLYADGKIILEWILQKQCGCGIDEYGCRQGPVADSCKCGKKSLGSVIGGVFLDQLDDY